MLWIRLGLASCFAPCQARCCLVDRIVSYTWAHIQGEHDEEDIAVGTSQQCAEVAHAVRRGAVVAGTERGPTGAEVHGSM